MSNTARKYSPSFPATVTPDNIEVRTGAKGPYTIMKNAHVESKNKTMNRTVMVFGTPHRKISDLLIAGEPISLSVHFDKGVIIADDLHMQQISAGDLCRNKIEQILNENGIHDDDTEVIIAQMFGEELSNRIVDSEEALIDGQSPEGSLIMYPILDHGIEWDDALEIAAQIDASYAGDFIRDMYRARTGGAA